MPIKKLFSASAFIALGIAIGMVLSDFSQTTKFPHDRYVLNLRNSETTEEAFSCAMQSVVFGDNVSEYDHKLKRQKNCLIIAAGTPREDGSFDAVNYSRFWYGRLLSINGPIHIPASNLQSIRLEKSLTFVEWVTSLFRVVNFP